MHEIPPKIKSSEMGLSPTTDRKTYNGDVPMSPKIIPKVTNTPAVESFLRFCVAINLKLEGEYRFYFSKEYSFLKH
jgi:hypothetical protein